MGKLCGRIALVVALAAPLALAEESAPAVGGRWAGSIDLPGVALGIEVTFAREGDGWSATIDIPMQNAAGLALRNVRVEGTKVHFELPAGPGLAVFDGTLDGDAIAGKFTQSVVETTFRLERAKPEAAAAEPVPYRTEDATFSNGDLKLAGSLTLPAGAGPFPAAVLITGSGPQDRDETVFGFKPFKLLADRLGRAGIATLRYDDRGVGGSSAGPADATTADFVGDVEAALRWLATRPEIAKGRVGLLGHSEGAIVAAMTAVKKPDAVAFVVMLAGPAVDGETLLRAQAAALVRAAGGGEADLAATAEQQTRLFAAVRSGKGWDELERDAVAKAVEQIRALPEAQRAAIGDPEAYAKQAVAPQLTAARSPWYRYFLDLDPREALAKVRAPMLALYGGKDLQVPAELDRDALERAAGGEGHDLTVRVFPEANHLFQKARTGSVEEYGVLPREFVDGMPQAITEWILAKTAPAK